MPHRTGEHLWQEAPQPTDYPIAPTVAVLPWGNVIEDFLDRLGVSLSGFCSGMSGGWLFGYVEALQRAGCRVVIFCVSTTVEQVTTFTHQSTGAPVIAIPASEAYRAMRRRIDDPYGWKIEEVVGRPAGPRRRIKAAVLRDLCFYLATPVRPLARELRRFGCDVILCQEYEYSRFDVCVALGCLLRLPVFATFQGGNWQMSRLERPIRPLAIRASAGLIIPTSSEVERVVARYGVPRTRIARIFNPLDLDLWSPIQRDSARAALGIPSLARVAIWHGRVDLNRKGLDVLLDAWRRVTSDRPGADLRLLLVGTGADAAVLRARLAADPLPGLHWRDEYVLDRVLMRRYLSAADFYVFPSRHEGFPVAPLEAMACGLPIVAADAPGIPDIFEAGDDHGGLVVPRDDAAALARAITTILGDRAYGRKLGENARRRARASFSLPAVGEQLRAFLSRHRSSTIAGDAAESPDRGAA